MGRLSKIECTYLPTYFPGLAARASVGLRKVLIYFEKCKTIFTDFAEVMKGEENKQTRSAKQNRQQSATAQHHTETQHHRTQHRGAGPHSKRQQTTGQQATRPDRDTSDKARQQKTTAENQTQQ